MKITKKMIQLLAQTKIKKKIIPKMKVKKLQNLKTKKKQKMSKMKKMKKKKK